MAAPRVDHTKVPCTGCGNARDCNRSRCRRCLADYKRDLRARNPEHHKMALREWCKNNREKIKGYSRQNYVRHKQRIIAYATRWNKEHPKQRSATMTFQNAKRKSRIRANGGMGFTKGDWRALLTRTDGLCAYCGEVPANSIDHFVPVSKGGMHDRSNIIPACHHCNSWKREHEPHAWVRENFGQERLDWILSRMFPMTPQMISNGEAIALLERALRA